ncbi:MAG: hypothetical protein KGL44_10305 [Sphingomonadales bacterium]|nr:hypothetical protein [Sphingomonadales bacterium]
MAHDEVTEDQSHRRFMAAVPNFVRMVISVESNPGNNPGYDKNIVTWLELRRPTETLGNMSASPRANLCGNPRCWGVQIDLVQLCRNRASQAGEIVSFDENLCCIGHERRRPVTLAERIARFLPFVRGNSPAQTAQDGYVLEDRLPHAECGNMLRVSGIIEFAQVTPRGALEPADTA